MSERNCESLGLERGCQVMPPGSSWPERNTMLGTRRSQPALPADSCPDQQAAQMPEDALGLARCCTISHYSPGPGTRTSGQGAASSCTLALPSCSQAAVEHIPPSPPLGGLALSGFTMCFLIWTAPTQRHQPLLISQTSGEKSLPDNPHPGRFLLPTLSPGFMCFQCHCLDYD